MPFLVLYLLKCSVSLAIVWCFYRLFLRKLTFYKWNRWYLLGYSILSFFIPFINILSLFGDDHADEPVAFQYIPSLGKYGSADLLSVRSSSAGLLPNVLLILIATGAAILLIRLAVRYVSLLRVRRASRLIGDTDIRVYQVDEPILPFSFGNTIYINNDLHTEEEAIAIILHEYVHIRQKHTVDILLAEALCIVNWYNPFVWMLRTSIRQNLEFIADREVLAGGIDKKNYQYHLLKVLGEPRYRLTHHFNFSSLKKRIIMMNKIKSARLHLVKFMFIVPFMAVLLLAFRDKVERSTRPQPVSILDLSVAIKPETPGKMRSIKAPIPIRRNSHRVTDTVPAPAAKEPRVVNLYLSKPASSLDKTLKVVDGVQMPADFDLKSIQPDEIGSIDVLKDEKALRYFGERAKEGVLVITTKTYQKKIGLDSSQAAVPLRHVDLGNPKPLMILDGVEKAALDSATLNPSDIASIEVVKGPEALTKYGEKGKNGVILITTKAAKSGKPNQK